MQFSIPHNPEVISNGFDFSQVLHVGVDTDVLEAPAFALARISRSRNTGAETTSCVQTEIAPLEL